jgi:hypothetical protein
VNLSLVLRQRHFAHWWAPRHDDRPVEEIAQPVAWWQYEQTLAGPIGLSDFFRAASLADDIWSETAPSVDVSFEEYCAALRVTIEEAGGWGALIRRRAA